jgi:exosortase/archaeosortase family protein
MRKIVMLGLAGATAIFLNVLRISFLTLWSYKHGAHTIDFDIYGNNPKSADFFLGSVHDLAGWTAMGISVALLACLIPVVNFKLSVFRPPAPPETQSNQ